MIHENARSIRTFLGAKDFTTSRQFYAELGFYESILTSKMSYFKVCKELGFYLQDAYVESWINNSMIFLEVDNVEEHWAEVNLLQLPLKYKGVKVSEIKHQEWGQEYFVHDPSGVLWHFGNFMEKLPKPTAN